MATATWSSSKDASIVAPALGLDRLLGHELRPGEQRLLRLRGLVIVAVGGDVAVPPDPPSASTRRPPSTLRVPGLGALWKPPMADRAVNKL